MNPATDAPGAENNFYYAILNLNKAASQSEINERHRALSLIFHPDKQRDEDSKIVATKKFLEIQKAYQVLSDPFLRDVYDVLGERGLSIKWQSFDRSKPREDVRKWLIQIKNDMAYSDFREKLLPESAVICALDASSFTGPYLGSQDDSYPRAVLNRLEDVKIVSYELKYSGQKRLNQRTTLSVEPRLAHRNRRLESTFTGTLRHQFSPRFTSEVQIGLLRPHVLRVGGTYGKNGNTVSVRASCALAALGIVAPSLNVSVSQKLFRHRPETATFEVNIGRQPQLSINLLSPSSFGLKSEESSDSSLEISAPPSISGLEYGVTHKLFGLSFDSVLPKLVAEWGVTFTELALHLKLGFEYGFQGLAYYCAGTWTNSSTTITAATQLNLTGALLTLEFAYLQQRISVPLVFSSNDTPRLAFWTVLLPSTALIVGHHFILKPRRRRQRLDYIRAARQALEAESGIRREREAIAGLLKDTVRKSTEAETSKGGLVIVKATYGTSEDDAGEPDLIIDVTIPLQALVRNSQLFISGDQPKVGIQGFVDPAPFTHKTLFIRYLFGGRVHYAEIPDDRPVVLPLAEHLVE